MKRLFPLFALLAPFFALSCRQPTMLQTEDEYITAMLANTAVQIGSRPDSIFHVLTTLLEENRNRLSAGTKGKIYQQKGDARSTVRDFDSANSLYLKAFQLAEKANDTIAKARIAINRGVIQHQLANSQKAIDYYRQARQILGNREGAENLLSIIYANLGSAFGDVCTDSARHYIQLGRELAQRTGNKGAEAAALSALGALFSAMREYTQAKQFIRESLQLYEYTADKHNMQIQLRNMVALLLTTNKTEEALPYLERGTQIAQQLGTPNFVMERFYLLRASAYLRERNYPKALEMSRRRMEIVKKWGDQMFIAVSSLNIGNIYNRMGEYGSALYYLSRTLEIAETNAFFADWVAAAHENIAYTHAAQGNMRQFTQAIQAARAHRDSLFTQQRFEVIQELQTRYETGLKQQEIIQQRQEIQTHLTTIFYLTIICVLIAVLSIVLYIFHRKKLQQQIQIIRQHEELSNYVRKGQQLPTKKTDDIAIPDDLSKKLLTALNQLFESEKIYRDADLNIVDVANKLESNRTYLSRVINLYHQKNFSDYVNYYRIEEAKEMLKAQDGGRYTNYTNEYIAEKVGFGSPAQFYRAFKQIVGITSSEYKQVVKGMQQQPTCAKINGGGDNQAVTATSSRFTK